MLHISAHIRYLSNHVTWHEKVQLMEICNLEENFPTDYMMQSLQK